MNIILWACLDGEPLKDKPNNPEKDLMSKTVCVNALLANVPNEKLSGEEKLERYENAMVIKKGGEINVTVETLSRLKKLIGKVYVTIISGQAWLMLEKAKAEEEGPDKQKI